MARVKTADMAEMSGTIDLEPWIIVDANNVATWKIDGQQGEALALFSSSEMAEEYRKNFRVAGEVRQLSSIELIKVLATAYQAGTEHAVLDPSESTSRSVFVIRHVLKAARDRLNRGDFDAV